jgi:hypothetical protein
MFIKPDHRHCRLLRAPQATKPQHCRALRSARAGLLIR